MDSCEVSKIFNGCSAAEFYVTYTLDGKVGFMFFDKESPASSAFIVAAREEAFSDCSGVSDIVVHHGKHEYRYTGWQPGMVLEFGDNDGNVVFSGCFESWDH